MYELIVLGLVPGTQIQITYETWLQVIVVLLGLYIGWSIQRSMTLRKAIISIRLFMLIRRPYA